MIRVYTAQAMPMVALLKNVLETEGIPCEIRNEFLGIAVGEIPPIECWPELWIINDDHEERARALVTEATQESEEKPGDKWRCQNCGEDVDPPLARCWNCETDRPGNQT